MPLSAPIYLLKQQAKSLSREENIPLHRALDAIARREGYRAWSHLSASAPEKSPAESIFSQLRPGELVLLGSRPGGGKTLLSLELAILAMRRGGQAALFTLDFTPARVAECFRILGEEPAAFADRFLLDDTDRLCAEHIAHRLSGAPPKTFVVVDYLQLLDQRRENPDLMTQVHQLRAFARERQATVLCLSQIDRKFEAAGREFPDKDDVRLPNPLDLGLFDRLYFLSQGRLAKG